MPVFFIVFFISIFFYAVSSRLAIQLTAFLFSFSVVCLYLAVDCSVACPAVTDTSFSSTPFAME